MLFADELTGWGAAAVGALLTAFLTALGVLIARIYQGRGGYVKDVAEATVTVDDAERKANREDEEAERNAIRDAEEAASRRESAILKEYKVLVAQLRKDVGDYREQIHEFRDEMQVMSNELAMCRTGRAKADERIANLEDALSEAGIPHRKWTPEVTEPPSDTHRHPKPPEGKKD